MRFLGLSSYEKGALRQETSRWWTVCSTFSRSGRSVARSSLFAKGGMLKKRLSPHLHKVHESTNFANGPHLTDCIRSFRVLSMSCVKL
jgi:hypothetical protein